MATFRNVYHEFMDGTLIHTPSGLVTIKPLSELERQYKASWRSTNVVRKNFLRRLKIMRFIEIEWDNLKKTNENATVDMVIRQLDARRQNGEFGTSLNNFLESKLPEMNVMEKKQEVVLKYFLPPKK